MIALIWIGGLAGGQPSVRTSAEKAASLAKGYIDRACDPHLAALASQVIDGLKADAPACLYHSGGGLTFVSGVRAASSGDLPILLIAPAGREPLGVLVYLVGGPGDELASPLLMAPSDAIGIDLARSGYAVAYLGYYGTAYGTLHPYPDVFAAARQVRDYVNAIRSRGSLPVTVVGVSAGAHVAYLAAREFDDVSIALLSPVISSPETLVARAKARPAGAAAYARTVVLRQRFAVDGSGLPGRKVEATQEQRMASFFGDLYAMQLTDLFRSYPALGPRPTIIVGDRDERIGLDHLPLLERDMPHIPVEVIEGFGHGPSNHDQARQLATTITQKMREDE